MAASATPGDGRKHDGEELAPAVAHAQHRGDGHQQRGWRQVPGFEAAIRPAVACTEKRDGHGSTPCTSSKPIHQTRANTIQV
jgi:hypothetical protein